MSVLPRLRSWITSVLWRRRLERDLDDELAFHIEGTAATHCNDSNFSDAASQMAKQGATVLFIPTNNSLPHSRSGEDLPAAARQADVARATENQVWIVRADVSGRTGELASAGSSEIVRPDGAVALSARQFTDDLLVASLAPLISGKERLNERRQIVGLSQRSS